MENKEILLKHVNDLAVRVNGEVAEIQDTLVLKVKGAYISEVLNSLKNLPEVPCDFLHDLTALDLSDHLEVVYQLSSLHGPQKVRVKAVVDRENPAIDSATRIWKGANYLEREAYDMFGIQFKGHPDLRRIYLWDDFEGYPLRKDYVTESAEQRTVVLPLKVEG